jgi:protein ImuB
LHETLNRLTALLGKERVGTPVLEDSHQADAFHLEPFVWKLTNLPEQPRHEPMIGPALRRLRLNGSQSPQIAVRTQKGPYVTSGNWWDEKTWERVEWDVALENGGVCRCREEPNELRLEAIYD